MSISFENGQGFRGDKYPNARLTSDRLRSAIVTTGKICSGEVVLIPTGKELVKILGVSRAALYNKGFHSVVEVVEHVTGLTVVSHDGLVLLDEDTALEPMADHMLEDYTLKGQRPQSAV